MQIKISNILKSIMLMLGFILRKMRKNHQMALFMKNVEKTYKSSYYSITFTASRMAWVAKVWNNTVASPILRRHSLWTAPNWVSLRWALRFSLLILLHEL